MNLDTVPKISLILVLNDLSVLDRVLVHILAQTEQNFELFVCHYNNHNDVDGLIEKWQDPRLNYIKLPVRGTIFQLYSLVFNLARGTYVYFMKDSAFLRRDALQTLIGHILSQNNDICVTHEVIEFSGKNGSLMSFQDDRMLCALDRKGFIEKILIPIFSTKNQQITNLLVSRKLILSLDNFFSSDEIFYYRNVEFFLKLLAVGTVFFHVTESLYTNSSFTSSKKDNTCDWAFEKKVLLTKYSKLFE